MKRFLFCLIVFAYIGKCWAGDPETGYGTLISVEFRVDNKFNRAVGILEYTGESIDIVGFSEGVAGIGIIATSQVYLILEKTVQLKGVHYLKGRNQYGTIVTGHIDFRNQVNPKVTLLTDGGTLITNTSVEGKEWHRKHIPNFILGQ